MASQSIGIALLGCGTVGGGVAQILLEQHELLARRTGIDFQLRHVVVKSESDYPPNAADLPMSLDAAAAIDDPKTDIVIELIGGTGIAATLVEHALNAGKPVVTANKALLASQGRKLFALARKNKSVIGFEAAAAGGIPIIDALMRGLVANRIDAILGIVNGTCNFILSKMTQNGWSYAEALKQAQAAGFAEANPAMDVEGRDAAQKLVILGSIAFNVQLSESNIFCQGIDGLDALDIRFASELGYVIKLLAIGQRIGGKLALRVHPTLVHQEDMLAKVSGSFNAVSVYAHALGHAFWYGRGAGRSPTASAVVADLVNIALGAGRESFEKLNILWDTTPPGEVLPFEDLQSRYYLRMQAKDQPGVMAQLTKILGDQSISLNAIRQHEAHEPDNVPIAAMMSSKSLGSNPRSMKSSLSRSRPNRVCGR